MVLITLVDQKLHIFWVFRKNVEKRSLLPHLESVFLLVDELIESG